MNEREQLLEIIRARSLLYGDITLSSGQKSHYYIDGKQTTMASDGIYLVARLMLPHLLLLPLLRLKLLPLPLPPSKGWRGYPKRGGTEVMTPFRLFSF